MTFREQLEIMDAILCGANEVMKNRDDLENRIVEASAGGKKPRAMLTEYRKITILLERMFAARHMVSREPTTDMSEDGVAED